MKTIVIGAGPAGLMAAIEASENGNEVTVIDHNEKAGKKLFLTGKGRCNVTNRCDEREFIAHVVSNPKFLFSAIHAFPSSSTMDFFQSRGVPLVIERGNRVFPESYHAYDITDCLVKEAKKRCVRLAYRENVTSIQRSTTGFTVITETRNYPCDFLVICTGGRSYPSTGSTGDGYRFAKAFGHTIVDSVPALTGLLTEERFPDDLIGFTLKNVSLRAKCGKFSHEEFGELMFSEHGIEGPIALSTSSLINRMDPSSVSLEIDLKAALDEKTLSDRIDRDISKKPNAYVGDLVRGLLPPPFLFYFLEKAEMVPEEKCCNFSKAKRRKLVEDLKHFKLTYRGVFPFERAIVTAGGVSTKEINSSTMESKIVPNLFFAGEVIDVDAFTGGFNIQIALSTGALAGKSIAGRIL